MFSLSSAFYSAQPSFSLCISCHLFIKSFASDCLFTCRYLSSEDIFSVRFAFKHKVNCRSRQESIYVAARYCKFRTIGAFDGNSSLCQP